MQKPIDLRFKIAHKFTTEYNKPLFDHLSLNLTSDMRLELDIRITDELKNRIEKNCGKTIKKTIEFKVSVGGITINPLKHVVITNVSIN